LAWGEVTYRQGELNGPTVEDMRVRLIANRHLHHSRCAWQAERARLVGFDQKIDPAPT
jgi:hypothetical protein